MNRRPGRIVRAAPPRTLEQIERLRAQRDPWKRLEAVQGSARGWRDAQLGILGILGVVGVVKSDQVTSGLPVPVRYLVLALVLLAFAAALSGAVLLTGAAWPTYRSVVATDPDQTDQNLERSIRKAQRAVRVARSLTVIAASAMGLAFALTWWPAAATGDTHKVQVRSNTGAVCGDLKSSTGEVLVLTIANQQLTMRWRDVLSLEPVKDCT